MDVILIAATTADGFIAREKSQMSTVWTSTADRQFFARKTKEIGVVVMGRSTYETIGKPLPGRFNVVMTSKPELMVRDPLLENLEYSNLDPQDLVRDLESRGYVQVAICGGASVYTQFLKQKLVNRMFLTIEPVMFGQGINLFNEHIDGIKLELIENTRLGDDGTVLMEYSIAYY